MANSIMQLAALEGGIVGLLSVGAILLGVGFTNSKQLSVRIAGYSLILLTGSAVAYYYSVK